MKHPPHIERNRSKSHLLTIRVPERTKRPQTVIIRLVTIFSNFIIPDFPLHSNGITVSLLLFFRKTIRVPERTKRPQTVIIRLVTIFSNFIIPDFPLHSNGITVSLLLFFRNCPNGNPNQKSCQSNLNDQTDGCPVGNYRSLHFISKPLTCVD